FFGEPNNHLSRANELRFGTNGSLKVDLKLGTWFDFEENEGGGVLDLIKRQLFFTTSRECFAWLEHEGLWKGNGKSGRDNLGWERVVVDTFYYHDRDGVLRYKIERIEFRKPDGSFALKDGKRQKTFKQWQPDPNRPGEWID